MGRIAWCHSSAKTRRACARANCKRAPCPCVRCQHTLRLSGVIGRAGRRIFSRRPRRAPMAPPASRVGPSLSTQTRMYPRGNEYLLHCLRSIRAWHAPASGGAAFGVWWVVNHIEISNYPYCLSNGFDARSACRATHISSVEPPPSQQTMGLLRPAFPRQSQRHKLRPVWPCYFPVTNHARDGPYHVSLCPSRCSCSDPRCGRLAGTTGPRHASRGPSWPSCRMDVALSGARASFRWL